MKTYKQAVNMLANVVYNNYMQGDYLYHQVRGSDLVSQIYGVSDKKLFKDVDKEFGRLHKNDQMRREQQEN